MASTALPKGEQLPLGTVLRSGYEDEGGRVLKAMSEALAGAGKSLDDVAAELDLDTAQLSRILNGRAANIPPRLLAYVLWHDRRRVFIRHLCSLSDGEFKPKPPPSAEEQLVAVRSALLDMGIWDAVAQRAGVAKPEAKP